MIPSVAPRKEHLKPNQTRRFDLQESESNPWPDLVVDSFEPSPNRPRVGDSVSFDVTVRNQGQAPAGRFSVKVDGDELKAQAQEVGPLKPGEQTTLRFGPSQVTNDEIHTYQTEVDPTNQVAESDENNNSTIDFIPIEDPFRPRPPLPRPPIPPVPPTRPPRRIC
jgi:subtilase family serine protease